MTARTLRSLVVLAAAAAASAGCGRVEGRVQWEEALHTQAPAARSPRDGVFPVPPPPFSPGVFPCSRCHEGGPPAKDESAAIPHALHVGRSLECADCHAPD